MNDYLLDRRAVHEFSSAYCPEQNGRVERQNHTIVEMMRTLLHSAKLPKFLWAELARTSSHIRNFIPIDRLGFRSPFEVWMSLAPDISHLRAIGSRAFVYVPDQQRHKLDSKCIEGILYGYDLPQHAFRVWLPGTRVVLSSPNVEIIEPFLYNRQFFAPPDITKSKPDYCPSDDQPVERVSDRTRSKCAAVSVFSPSPDTTNLKMDCLMAPVLSGEVITPESFRDAVESPQSQDWINAMKEEMKSHRKNKTWTLVDRSSCKRTPLSSRWVYKVKVDQHGDIERFKARLVVRGCSQKVGVDYTETFAPVARFETIRMFLAVAVCKNYGIRQFDIKTAFLNGEIDEELYMAQPEGFGDGSGRICRLLKSLYGLKQAPRLWNATFDHFLQKFGMTQSQNDPCLYSNNDLMVVLYVDDGLIACRTEESGNALVRAMCDAFEATTSPAQFYLGIHVIRSSDRRSVKIHQGTYVRSLLRKFGMADCSPVATPAEGNTFLTTDQHQTIDVPYRQLVGALMYMTVATRPDIAFIVHRLSQFLDTPSEVHWKAAKRVLRYLKGTPNVGITYTSDTPDLGMLELYTDSDFAMCSTTRKSTTGVIIKLCGGPVSWLSRKQGVVSCSTTEAEYIAAHDGAREVVWTRGILSDMKMPQLSPTPLYCDNAAARSMIENSSFHNRGKHIDIKFHYTRSLHKKEIYVTEISTKDQLADIMTKPLFRPTFEHLKHKLNIH